MIRLIIIFLFLIVFFFIGLFINGVMYISCKGKDEKRYRISNPIGSFAFQTVLCISGVRKKVMGRENIPDEIVLFVSNHRGFFDIISTDTVIKQPVGYVAKSEMTSIPFLSTWMRNIGCVFMNRTDPKGAMKTIVEGTRRLAAKECSMFIFPEGTRSKTQEMGVFKKGSFRMAQKAKVPIVPVAVWNSERVFEENPPFWKVRAAKVYMNFGTPIHIEELEPEQQKHIDLYVQEQVKKLLVELKENFDLVEK